MKKIARYLACASLMLVALIASAEVPSKSMVFHFATVGDSREEPAPLKLSEQEMLWLQNTKVLARMLREMQAAKPQALFFNGDMIYGYSQDRAVLDRHYAYWRGMVANLMETGTYVVPVPGNHEVQIKVKDQQGREIKTAVVESENAWRANMGDLILNQPRWQALTELPSSAWSLDNAPRIGADGITSDQRQLSYSFDAGNIHFAIINTDPAGFDDSAPVQWLETDFAAARRRGVDRFFVFGHKVAFTYLTAKQKNGRQSIVAGFDARPENRDAFWDLVEAYQAVYFTGHQHVYHAEQPRKDRGGKAWHVIVGSGGSNFSVWKDAIDHAHDRAYAWADVSVYSDNSVHIKILGFDEDFGPTRVIEAWDIQP